MAQPLVIAHHVIWTVYGTWLPNDPRGSGSTVIRKAVLAELGGLHHGRKKIQPPRSDLRSFLSKAAGLLEYPVLLLDDRTREEVAAAFAKVIEEEAITCYACAIMPDHVHIVVRKHKYPSEVIGELLQDASRERVRDLRRCAVDHPVWCAGPPWKIFLDHPEEVRRTIPYIDDNPLKIGLPRQRWPFVKGYDNWPLHEGHSDNSPYVKALKVAGRYP